uniref:Uncharacterized protein n=1 Tax=Pseudo-nitzschia australis TaxID=44445 RepID=A0A7S4AXB6_9STRA|mmetsp:Transcript_178/g.518  ORF Transcript_178/g.518 Transcript_178/m.518 type:complete len:181 (+) Transcript_178:94-636(+)
MSSPSRQSIASSIDIENRLPSELEKESCSCCSDDEKKPRSLPFSQINWEVYCKSGSRASFAWLFLLFSILGLVVQQSAAMNTAGKIPSKLDDVSSFSPPVIARTRKMTTAKRHNPSVSETVTNSMKDENINNEQFDEATSINDKIRQQNPSNHNTSSIATSLKPASRTTGTTSESNAAQE